MYRINKINFTVMLTVIVYTEVISQDTGVAILSEYLKECYSDPYLMNRNNLPPMKLEILLDLVRKIEDHPSTVGDMRQISTGILHLFRQDGIVLDPTVQGSPNIVPYSPTGFPAYKNRLLLNKLLPNNQFTLPNNCLNSMEKCTLHQILSSSILMENRGDDETTCKLIRRNPKSRRRRDTASAKRSNEEVEVFDVRGARDMYGKILGTSLCPMETGVVSTSWGSLSAGPVMAGVSSGLEPQMVLVSDLVPTIVKNDSWVVNSRYAATIAGDIAEAAVLQGTAGRTVRVGAGGGWNSTLPRRHYFLSQNVDVEFTDAEIRGDTDGLILSDLAEAYVTKSPGMRLSQFLDMYYSEGGILHNTRFRACNRRTLVTTVAASELLRQHSLPVALALYHTTPAHGTVSVEALDSFVASAVTSFNARIAESLVDPVCSEGEHQAFRPRVNLLLVAALTRFNLPLVSYIVDGIQVGKFGSSVTMLDPASGDVAIDKTFSQFEFYRKYAANMTESSEPLKMVTVLQALEVLVKQLMDEERVSNYAGGNSTVVLVLSETVVFANHELTESIHLAQTLRSKAPDLRLMFATSSAMRDQLQPLVREPGDVVSVTLATLSDSLEELAPLLQRINEVPRRIVNPVCGYDWVDTTPGMVELDGFVDANGVDLYSISPNYFFRDNDERKLKIESFYGSLRLCYSRTDAFPRRNMSTSQVAPDVTCATLAGQDSADIALGGACAGHRTALECPPLFLTVSSVALTESTAALCTEAGCRYPDDVRYRVSAQQLGCHSAAAPAHPAPAPALAASALLLASILLEALLTMSHNKLYLT